ncbi:helix-turn-helix domain-containing protein [Nocardioides carbamazepini]|uniref:helix-turn-helix domain-containing protein n=1 Tax=Nocardioides carbamazepini TaxID=2854259 RepID=UPI00214A3FF7|nr:helix-turn-helix transcriptional regulator [Nocardioides carbamazepini]MCR1784587.1 helix-turn-helix domain-containing protein [Nocardioides carbamazepini]
MSNAPSRLHPVHPATTSAVIEAVLARRERVRPGDRAVWDRFLALLDERPDDPRSARLYAVVANLVAVVAFADADDHVVTAQLAEAVGEKQLARLQHRAAALLEVDSGRRWTADACRRWTADDVPAEVAASCAATAYALVLHDVESVPSATPVRTVGQLLALLARGSVAEWRAHLGIVAASPWGPYAHELLRLAERSRSPQAQAVVEQAVARCRERREASERALVARDIKACIVRAGISQREFAAHVGTSPSRLSTYVTGAVVPSAAMLLRIRRVSRLLRDRSAEELAASRGA